MMNDEQGSQDALLRAGDEDAGAPGMVGAVADQPESARGAGAHRAQSRGKRGRSFWIEFPLLVVIALTIALLIKSFVVQAFYIPTSSMENTLLVGDKVLVNKIVYDIRPVARGDIIVFSGQGSWDPVGPPAPHSSNPLVELYDVTLGKLFSSIGGLFGTVPGQTDYIKRVIGIPGDRVACCTPDGYVTVNGVPLHEQSYLIPGAKPSDRHFRITVPPGRLWVMGDNRPISSDSRFHMSGYQDAMPSPGDGTIPEDKVVGRAFVIVWPPSRWRILSIPATFSQPALSRAAGQAAPGPGTAALLDHGVEVHAGPPYLPLAAGLGTAIPLTLLVRRIRVRGCRRRRR
jgi:signal peptidase I